MIKAINKNRGLWYSLMQVLPYAIIPLFFLINFQNQTNNFSYNFLRGSILTLGKDFLSGAMLVLWILVTRKGRRVFELAKTKAGIYAMIAGMFGGPIGYTLFNTAFYMSGASFAHIFSSLEPIILAMFAYFIFKRKLKWQMWIGVSLAVLGIILLVFESAFQSGDPMKVIIGSALALGGAAAWAIETFLFDKAFNHAPDAEAIDLISLKVLFALFINFAMFLPAIGSGTGDIARGYVWFSEFFTNMDFFWRFLLAGTLIFSGRMLYFAAIRYKGGTYVAVIYELTVVVTPVIALIWYGVFGVYPGASLAIAHEHLMLQWQLVFWTSAVIIVGGTLMVIKYSPIIERPSKINVEKTAITKIS